MVAGNIFKDKPERDCSKKIMTILQERDLYVIQYKLQKELDKYISKEKNCAANSQTEEAGKREDSSVRDKGKKFEEPEQSILRVNEKNILVLNKELLNPLGTIQKGPGKESSSMDSICKDQSISKQGIYMLNKELSLKLDEEVLLSLAGFIRKYMQHSHLLDTGFNEFMLAFLGTVQPAEINAHIKCLSHLHNVNLEYYRKFYGYGKIYQCFKDTLAGLSSVGADSSHVSLLVQLLNNNQLVYKNLLPTITKISSYTPTDAVDKSIVPCCTVLTAVVSNCAECFSDPVIFALASYLLKILYTPQSFLFFNSEELEELVKAVRTLSRFSFSSFSFKRNALGLLRECIGKIQEFRNSTVHEEVLVVVNMAEVLSDVFGIAVRQGNQDFNFVPADVLDFYIFRGCAPEAHPIGKNERDSRFKTQNLDTPEPPDADGRSDSAPGLNLNCKAESTANKRLHNDFYKSFSFEPDEDCSTSLERKCLIALQTRFIQGKYRFMDAFYGHQPCFNRIAFYEDLLRVPEPNALFRNLSLLKSKIDWSDMIVYACNAHSKASYIPLLFDETYTGLGNHHAYVKIFLNSIREDPITLLYFAKKAVMVHYDRILADVYSENDYENPIGCRIQNLILEYINEYNEETSIMNADDDNCANFNKNAMGLENLVLDFLKKLKQQTISARSILLFLTCLSKKLPSDTYMKIFQSARKCLKGEGEPDNLERILLCLCAIALNKTGCTIFDAQEYFSDKHDILISLINYKLKFPKNTIYYNKIKSNAFEAILCLSSEEISEIRALCDNTVSVKSDSSVYISECAELESFVI